MTATDRAVELVEIAAAAASDKLASDIIAYDVSDQLVITDAFLLCSASNDRQVHSVVDEIEDRLRKAGAKPVRREGEREGRWVLLDYVDIVVHVQHAEERVYYALERLWKDCPVIPTPEPVGARAGGSGAEHRAAGPGRAGAALSTPARSADPWRTAATPSSSRSCCGGTARPCTTRRTGSRARPTSRSTRPGASRPPWPRATWPRWSPTPSSPPTSAAPSRPPARWPASPA